MSIVYNPSVNDRSGEILAGGIAGAAQINAQGQMQAAENLSRGIASAADSVGGAIGQAGQIFAQNKAKLSSSYGKIEALGNMGYLAPEEADELSKIKDPDKLAGSLAVIEQQFQSDMVRKRQMDAMNMRMMEEKASRADSRVGTTTTMTDPISGQQVGAYFQNDRQVVPFQTPQPVDPGVQGVRKVQVGPGEFMYVDAGTGKPISPNMIAQSTPDPVKQATLTKLEADKARLAGEVAAGRGESSATWWPWSKHTNAAELKSVEAQLDTLKGGGEKPAAAGPAKITSKAEYDALPSGTQYVGPSGKIATKP